VAKIDRLRNSITLATILACRKSTTDSTEAILTQLEAIKDDQVARGINTAAVEAILKQFGKDVQAPTESRLDSLQDAIEQCLNHVKEMNEGRAYEETRSHEREIINWLAFRQILWRYDSIDEAHRNTYRWIFDDSTLHNSWDDFTPHLREDIHEPYFMNGKAGSGKSTLMKYIHQHDKTGEALNHWAQSKELMTVNFFFWNLGTSLQKSHVGMLRALLHDVLERYPELTPAAFPRLYKCWSNTDTSIEPTYVELKTAFRLLIQKATHLKLAFFIDGIDEFDGDHRDMAQFLQGLASPDVKMVVSSRPVNACLETFRNSPTLTLQDLTREDMN
jgi:hypothetical protein